MTSKELIKLGFEETYVTAEESGGKAFKYYVFDSPFGTSLISDSIDEEGDTPDDIKITFFNDDSGYSLSEKFIRTFCEEFYMSGEYITAHVELITDCGRFKIWQLFSDEELKGDIMLEFMESKQYSKFSDYFMIDGQSWVSGICENLKTDSDSEYTLFFKEHCDKYSWDYGEARKSLLSLYEKSKKYLNWERL